ncbi:hypothetical protein EHI8A_243540 [Entamoeba histolytica HM-1:IMSS-B]|uniref:Uncharacterized protein n=1 Tax=Entamoeba histolytica HM-1:IMSS-B TaxID=885319 RepID=M3UYP5_ENTH1|nr:hypothetical protein EHI8A_243540 [Entamoeba histolytica HM-1:IMSS-B]
MIRPRMPMLTAGGDAPAAEAGELEQHGQCLDAHDHPGEYRDDADDGGQSLDRRAVESHAQQVRLGGEVESLAPGPGAIGHEVHGGHAEGRIDHAVEAEGPAHRQREERREGSARPPGVGVAHGDVPGPVGTTADRVVGEVMALLVGEIEHGDHPGQEQADDAEADEHIEGATGRDHGWVSLGMSPLADSTR